MAKLINIQQLWKQTAQTIKLSQTNHKGTWAFAKAQGSRRAPKAL